MTKSPLASYLTPYNQDYLQQLLKLAWMEDVQSGDHSTLATIPENATGQATLYAKDSGIIAGLGLVQELFNSFSDNLKVVTYSRDGEWVQKGDQLFNVEGSVRGMLTGERTVLNVIQHLSGIATKTCNWCQYLEGYHTHLLDTRKTTPGLRLLEKWATALGGAANHRIGLYDMLMIKDNHIDYAGGMHKAIDAVKTYLEAQALSVPVVIETRSLEEVRQVLAHPGIARILLDNMTLETMAEAVRLIDGQCETEASGGIQKENLRPIAETGVDYISSSQLTRNTQPLDMSLKIT